MSIELEPSSQLAFRSKQTLIHTTTNYQRQNTNTAWHHDEHSFTQGLSPTPSRSHSSSATQPSCPSHSRSRLQHPSSTASAPTLDESSPVRSWRSKVKALLRQSLTKLTSHPASRPLFTLSAFFSDTTEVQKQDKDDDNYSTYLSNGKVLFLFKHGNKLYHLPGNLTLTEKAFLFFFLRMVCHQFKCRPWRRILQSTSSARTSSWSRVLLSLQNASYWRPRTW